MANLGKYGLLDGLGKGVSSYASAIRDQWIMQAQQQEDLAREQRGNVEWERREKARRAEDEARERRTNQEWDRRESTRHANDLETAERRRTGNLDEPPSPYQKVGENLIRTGADGQEYILDPATSSWRPIAAPGTPASQYSDPDMLRADAEDYADTRISEMAGAFRSDKNDFQQWGGSREAARQHFIQEFIRGNSGQGGQVREGAGGSQQGTSTSGRPSKEDFALDAKEALQRGISRAVIVQRLKQQGFTDDEIRQFGI